MEVYAGINTEYEVVLSVVVRGALLVKRRLATRTGAELL